jgi:hypothetical protein
MCAGWRHEDGSDEWLRDPLIRLVMNSDGVTEEAMIGVLRQLRHDLAARERRTRLTNLPPESWRHRVSRVSAIRVDGR